MSDAAPDTDQALQGNRMNEAILKRFDKPDEVTIFEKGKFEIVSLGGMTIGRATYQPGWKWSEDVGAGVGEKYCTVEHVGLVVSGCATAAFRDGRIIEMRTGDLFYVPPEPHDSWVVGDEAYVSLHFLGAGKYARKSNGQ
jgi:hypothetical protein